jgi:DNA-binding NarL/FixJ family response regulator
MPSTLAIAPVFHHGELSVVVAMRHPAMRAALWAVIQDVRGVRPLGAAGDLRDAVQLIHHSQPEVVLVDESILGAGDLRRLATLRAAAPGATFIVLGLGEHAAYATHARNAGAFDYIRMDQATERMPEVMSQVVQLIDS